MIIPGQRRVIRRYAPDSVKFADAKESTLAEIKVGDQVRARGDKSDGRNQDEGRRDCLRQFQDDRGDGGFDRRGESQMTVKDLDTKKLVR